MRERLGIVIWRLVEAYGRGDEVSAEFDAAVPRVWIEIWVSLGEQLSCRILLIFVKPCLDASVLAWKGLQRGLLGCLVELRTSAGERRVFQGVEFTCSCVREPAVLPVGTMVGGVWIHLPIGNR